VNVTKFVRQKLIYDFSRHWEEEGTPKHPHADWVIGEVIRGTWDARKRAKLKKLPFELNHEVLAEQVIKNKYRCALSTIPFRKDERFYRNPYRPSLDRIDTTKGYTHDNIRIVAYCVNAAMNEWGFGVLEEVSRGINGAWRIKSKTDRKQPPPICSACGYEYAACDDADDRCRWCEIEYDTRLRNVTEHGRWDNVQFYATALVEAMQQAGVKVHLTTPLKSQDAQQSGGLHRLQHAGR
jgi:hypothetical protein